MRQLKFLRVRAWHVRSLFLASVITWQASALGETKLDFWHSYVPPNGSIHYSFQIARYKRGLFFGSCGPSTRSLQWAYNIDLAGPGPVYNKEQITITSDLKRLDIVSGTVKIDLQQSEATLNLRVRSSSGESDLPANGTHSIKKLK